MWGLDSLYSKTRSFCLRLVEDDFGKMPLVGSVALAGGQLSFRGIVLVISSISR